MAVSIRQGRYLDVWGLFPWLWDFRQASRLSVTPVYLWVASLSFESHLFAISSNYTVHGVHDINTLAYCQHKTVHIGNTEHNHILPINLFSQLPRWPKRHHFSWGKHHNVSSCRVPTFSFLLFIYTKFSKVTDQDILTRFKGTFYYKLFNTIDVR